MEDKKYLKISLGTAICIGIIIILIIALVCLGFYTYNIKNSSIEKSSMTSKDDIYQSAQNVSSDTSKDIINDNADVGEEISINDNTVKSLVDKIDFNTYAIASIYKVGTFNINNIPNDLILRLGWDKIDSSNKSTLSNILKETATSEVMKQSITNIFGAKVKYTDNSFDKIDVEKFHGYKGSFGSERNDNLC